MGSRPDDGEQLDELSEINVTPFIDVMLVLLIIFMVAAPLATVDVNVDLPASTAAAAPRPDEPVYVTLQADGSIALANSEIGVEALPEALDNATGGDPEARIYLRADRNVEYGELMGLMNRIRDAGWGRIGLVGLETVPAS
ncbi:outer membrane transport energization protein ExbD [Paracoccus solventivorans]|uniref:Biopolymer transport protein ExbD n=1 Tax=Paracoccus solventivorans TaxID=53463 RepID=A0A1M7F2G5_9RHOB|nr:TonB system transport protein ExbD [Paracoccus solventivorans]SHL97859.1 outer membrane transport energization protein ExbD [Paracoccus solventivorans]HMM09913.1 TonB system transport protein ExbD [Paracoccus solventivorans]